MQCIYSENQQFNLLIILLKKICKKNPYFPLSFGNSVYFCKTSLKRNKHGTNNQRTSNL